MFSCVYVYEYFPGQSRAVSAGDAGVPKIPSISLGLPELPSGIRQTRPFTYSRKAEYDFTLGKSISLMGLQLCNKVKAIYTYIMIFVLSENLEWIILKVLFKHPKYCCNHH